MADFLVFRGPDRSQIWHSGNAGLCHTLLRTRIEHDDRPLIASLDGCVRIAGDVRIDDRVSLTAELQVANAFPSSRRGAKALTASSAELILHAYAVWKEDCVAHLLGDFAFIIWDERRRIVFAARDQLGVKPLYYSRVGPCLLISNTLDCIRQIPIVSNALNEQAIGDYLIGGMNFNPATTFFSGIQRLPVAHSLLATTDGLQISRYWTLPIDEPLYYRRKGDYVDRFHELIRASVGDRLPDGPLGVFMSGGLDSPVVAATAVQLGASVTAFTSVYDRLIPDEERYYSGLVAAHLEIPIKYRVQDDSLLGWEPEAAPIHTPEPIGDPLGLFSYRKYLTEVAEHARVFFFGDGPDAALLNEWRSHVGYLVDARRWGRLLRDLVSHFAIHQHVPPIQTLSRMWTERNSNHANGLESSFPSWINPDLASRLGLEARWLEINTKAASPHPTRPRAYASFVCDFPMCGGENDGVYVGTMEELHPLGDLRLVRFLLAVPAVPWCREKYLIREAAKTYLPTAVRRRPKTPLAGLPYYERARRLPRPDLPPLPALACYVDANKLPKWPGRDREEFDHSMRVLDLHYWLLGLQFR